jgi:uncharacterized protein YgfB (UPF0149 family)
MIQVTFAEVQRAVDALGSTMTAAEGHGYMCGALCTDVRPIFERWLEEVASAEARPIANDIEEPLRLLAADTERALRGDEMEFEPFLPDDDVALAKRTLALAEWCQGFLYGFSSGAVPAAQWPQNVSEVLRDLTQISRVETDVGEAGEEDEQSYSEVVEFVRVGVQLLYDELHAPR